ncbi:MAG TPA: CvpA family protein [bacterium]|jgi:uncharacterized membrane protein required for colicin V production
MTLPDLVVLTVLLVFAISGIRHGVVWELFIVLGLLLGFALTYAYHVELMDLVLRISSPGWQRPWIGGLVFLFFFMVIYLGFAAIGHRLHEALARTPFGWVDNLLGIAGGALKGAVLIGLLVASIEWVGEGGQVREFIWHSHLIQWGKETVSNVMRWESPSKKQWV